MDRQDPTVAATNAPAEVPSAQPTSFRTKTGHCDVTRDRLVLLRTGPRGAVADAIQGRSRARTFGVYGVLVTCMTLIGANSWSSDRPIVALMWWGYAAWVVFALARSRDFSTATEVPRAATTRVEAIRGWRVLTRDRLVVHFTDDGKPARRFILLPGVLQDGGGELERAVALLREAGWPVGE